MFIPLLHIQNSQDKTVLQSLDGLTVTRTQLIGFIESLNEILAQKGLKGDEVDSL